MKWNKYESYLHHENSVGNYTDYSDKVHCFEARIFKKWNISLTNSVDD